MEHNWLLYLAGFSIAFAVSMLMTPFAKKIAFKLKAIDYPKSRGLNKEPMPRIGGLAIFLGFLASVGILAFFVEIFIQNSFLGF